jgi:hypothetical protein
MYQGLMYGTSGSKEGSTGSYEEIGCLASGRAYMGKYQLQGGK